MHLHYKSILHYIMEGLSEQALKLGNTYRNHMVNNQCLNLIDQFLFLFFQLDMDMHF